MASRQLTRRLCTSSWSNRSSSSSLVTPRSLLASPLLMNTVRTIMTASIPRSHDHQSYRERNEQRQQHNREHSNNNNNNNRNSSWSSSSLPYSLPLRWSRFVIGGMMMSSTLVVTPTTSTPAFSSVIAAPSSSSSSLLAPSLPSPSSSSSPPPPPSSLGRRVSLLSRLLAVFIDGIFIGAIAALLTSGVLSFVGIAAAGAQRFTLVTFILRPLYYCSALVLSNGQSLGRSMMHLRVRRIDHKDMDIWTAVKRTAGTVFVGLDWLWCLGDRNQRCLHDVIAGTIVVEDRPNWRVLE